LSGISGPKSINQSKHYLLSPISQPCRHADDWLVHVVLCVPTGLGYIAYAMMFNGPEFLKNRTAVVLSDPVCNKEHYCAIAEAFIKEHPKAMFAQVSLQPASGLIWMASSKKPACWRSRGRGRAPSPGSIPRVLSEETEPLANH